MPVGPDLIAAYLGAEYAVFGEPELVLRIGEPSAALEALLEAEGADTAAYVSAANPHGRQAGKTENVLATTALLEAQREEMRHARRHQRHHPGHRHHPHNCLNSRHSRSATLGCER